MSSTPEDEEAETQAELAARNKNKRRSVLGWGAPSGLGLGKRPKIELSSEPEVLTRREAGRGTGIFLIVIAVLILLWNLGDAYRGIASHWWPSATATVTNAQGWPQRTGRYRTGYNPRITVSFKVDGTDRKGNILLDDQLFGMKDNAAAYAERAHPVGRPVQVYYQPGHPEMIKLETGTDSLTEMGLWLGGLLLAAGMAMYRTTRKSRDEPTPPSAA